jgi:hypothetical protein
MIKLAPNSKMILAPKIVYLLWCIMWTAILMIDDHMSGRSYTMPTYFVMFLTLCIVIIWLIWTIHLNLHTIRRFMKHE